MKQIALVGNPNTGKTTLFNVLTGSRQSVGNWAGVTVERKSGTLKYQDHKIEVVDLPGIYSLNVSSANVSVDEKIACDYILSDAPELIVNIVDATHLERSLYLTIQLQEMGVPILLVVTMLDIARLRKKHIDLEKLGQQFGCKVVGVVANKKKGIEQLQKAIVESLDDPLPAVSPVYDKPVEKAINYLAAQLFANKRWRFRRSGQSFVHTRLVPFLHRAYWRRWGCEKRR